MVTYYTGGEGIRMHQFFHEGEDQYKDVNMVNVHGLSFGVLIFLQWFSVMLQLQ